MPATAPTASALTWLFTSTTAITTASGATPPVELLWVTQAVTLAVGLSSGWFALRSKRGETADSRQARFDARVDKDLDDALTAVDALRRELADALRRTARYEAHLIRHGINPDTGEQTGNRPLDPGPPPG
ncbi:hypothetical protein [Actinoplanes sp. NPDC026623]|uniref:hypothetical protein n=1 Tax=Actinoplanes sp. NPDC026623 TaxID=3155610 RepID=UPI0033E3EE4C